MKRIFLLLTIGLALTACAQQKSENAMKQTQISQQNGKVLVAFFSHTGENYAVGNITKGNTHIVAEMIAQATGGDLFEIEPVNDYPTAYDPCTQVAQQEKRANARPAIKADHDVEPYDTIYVGYPIWWGDAPMPVYTWIDAHQWQGKTVIPFCTHEGSGLGSSGQQIGRACKGATLGKGLEMRGYTAQNERDKARQLVAQWLGK